MGLGTMMKLPYITVLALSTVFVASGAGAETPLPGGLPPLPPPTRIEQLQNERELLEREAREIGGRRTIQESLRSVNLRISERLAQIKQFEEVAKELGTTIDELENMQAEAKAEVEKIAKGSKADEGIIQGTKLARFMVSRLVDQSLRRVARGLGFVADLTIEGMTVHIKNVTTESFQELIDKQRLNLRDINNLLLALYKDVAVERIVLKRLQEIDRRNAEIIREIVAERERAEQRRLVRQPVLDREQDTEYDRLLDEIERVRFQLKLAEFEGKRADVELLRRRLTELERLADELDEVPPSNIGMLPGGCGTGLFYIPGTDTCLTIGGYVRTSFQEVASSPGIGTIRTGTNETMAFSFSDSLQYWGGGIGLEYGLGSSMSVFGIPSVLSYRFVFGEVAGSWAEAQSEGSLEIGADINLVGATLLREDPTFGTGWSAVAPGFGLSGSADINSTWATGWVGLGHTVPLESREGSGSALVLKAGPFIEGIDFDSSGRMDLTFLGSPFGGVFQTYDLETRDLYVGVKAEAAYVWQPSSPLQFSVGASLSVGYHGARGWINQETGFPGGIVYQSDDYRRDSPFLGFGVSASVKWIPDENVSIESGVTLDFVPNVTAYQIPENPSMQPGSFAQEDIWRLGVKILQAKVSF